MKYSLTIVLLLIVIGAVYAGETTPQVSTMKQDKRLAAVDPHRSAALGVLVAGDGSTSNLVAAPQGSVRYSRTCYLITAEELAHCGVPDGAQFTRWGFRYATAQDRPTSGAMKIYLQNTYDDTWTKNRRWSNGTSGTIDDMTLVHDGMVTIPAATGPFDITLSKGGDFTYTGGGLYVAFEYQNATGAQSSNNTASSNMALLGGANGVRYASSTVAMPDSMKNSSAFRPETRAVFTTGKGRDAEVSLVYSYGRVPLGYGGSVRLSARVRNNGTTDQTNVAVHLAIKGVDTFASTKIVPSLSREEESYLVTFDDFTPTKIGLDTVTVFVDADDNNDNNTRSSTLRVMEGSFAYMDAYDQSWNNSGIGFTTNGGLFLNRYTIHSSAKVHSVTFDLLDNTTNVGKTVYGVLLDATGSIMARTDDYVIPSAALDGRVSLPFSVMPTVTDQEIYFGVAQKTAGFYPVVYQDEDPIRQGAFYTSSLTGSSITELTKYGALMMGLNLNAIPAPTSINAKSTWPGRFMVYWDSVSGAAKYTIDIATDSLFANVVAGYANKEIVVDNMSAEDVALMGLPYDSNRGKKRVLIENLPGGITYFFRLRAADGKTVSASAPVAKVSVPGDELLAPKNLIVGNDFNNCIPIQWSKPPYLSQLPTYSVKNDSLFYTVYRKTDSTPYTLLDSTKNYDYLDTTVTPHQRYTYRIGFSYCRTEVLSLTEATGSCATAGYELRIPTGTVQPTVDGTMTEPEWSDAVRMNIRNGLGSSLSSEFGNGVPANDVFASFKRMGDELFIGIKDQNPRSARRWDIMFLYFDCNANGILDESDRVMGLIDTAGTATMNMIVTFTNGTTKIVNDSSCIHGSSRMVNGASEWEIRIDLRDSLLNMSRKKTMGMTMALVNDIASTLNGCWPNAVLLEEPRTYGRVEFIDDFTSVQAPAGLPREYALAQNYPNPFNPTTTFRYAVPKQGLVEIRIFDVLGREVKTLVHEQKAPGEYSVTLDAGGLASGLYLYQMRAGDFVQTRRMLLVK